MVHTAHLELVVATNNPGKIAEIQNSLHDLPVTLRYLSDFDGILDVEESGATYEANALLKAVSYARQTGVCALADDSGLEVDALGGAPGVLSARYGDGSDQERTKKLLKALSDRPADERGAQFVCCMVLAGWRSGRPEGIGNNPKVLHISQQKCEGRIADQARGQNGFGYDPIFIPRGYDQTFGELASSVKDAISHRAKTLAGMREFLNQWIAST